MEQKCSPYFYTSYVIHINVVVTAIYYVTSPIKCYVAVIFIQHCCYQVVNSGLKILWDQAYGFVLLAEHNFSVVLM